MTDRAEPVAWVKLPTTEEAYERLGSQDAHPYGRAGVFPTMGRLALIHEPIGRRALALVRTAMFETEYLTRAEAELLAMVSAAAQRCRYATRAHAELFRAEGGDAKLADALENDSWQTRTLPPRTRALCEIAHKLSGQPTDIVAADWQPLRDLGFDDRGIMEVAHIVSLWNYFTRLADGLGVQPATRVAHQAKPPTGSGTD